MRAGRLQAHDIQTQGHRVKESAMKRMHVHVSVEDIGKSVAFYAALFAEQPAVLKDDYAKWMLEDPRMNFADLDARPRARPRSPRHSGRKRG